MQLQRFRVYTDDPDAPTTHDLTLIPADRMRAERASTAELAPTQRGEDASKHHPNTWLMLWLWCSATRVGVTSAKFSDWCATVLDFDPLDADGNVKTRDPATQAHAGDDPTLDPTQRVGATT